MTYNHRLDLAQLLAAIATLDIVAADLSAALQKDLIPQEVYSAYERLNKAITILKGMAKR